MIIKNYADKGGQSDSIDLCCDTKKKKLVILKNFNDQKSFDIEKSVYENLSKKEGYGDYFLPYNQEHTDNKNRILCFDLGDIDL